ncbi:MAG: HD domain-containing protein [Clostridiaceae bacterium]|nr:HD domain-containing protein [Clostridiaceae bacterium]
MDNDRLSKQLAFIIEVDKAKQILRNTILMDASRRENDAEHMWHLALGVLVFSEHANSKELDLLKVLKMALIHDIVEIDAGDTYAYGEYDGQAVALREQKAARRIFGVLPADQATEFNELWDEFEAAETPEAKFAKAMDSFMPVLHNYQTQGQQWQKHQVTKERIYARNARIEKGSGILWEKIKELLRDAVEKGYLQP